MASTSVRSGGCYFAIVCVIMLLATEAGFNVATSMANALGQASAFTLNDQHQGAVSAANLQCVQNAIDQQLNVNQP